jgi:hypothetical protein
MLIFLDIDGVMVPAKGWQLPDTLSDGFPVFSIKATAALKRLIANNCKVILTTSHKSNYTNDQWKQIFEVRGLQIKHLECLPANTQNLSRKEELLGWFNINNCGEDFIILDDDKGLNDLPQHLKNHLVQISPFIGLTEDDIDTAEAMLDVSKGA